MVSFDQIDQVCQGWSTQLHQKFFHWVLTEVDPSISRVLVLGVYRGRDMAYFSKILSERGGDFQVVGVDLFCSDPCNDWREDQRGQTWEEAYQVPPPDYEVARKNLKALGFKAELHQSDAVAFLQRDRRTWDLIYIDTSHDYRTTKDTIDEAARWVPPEGWLAGDDCIDGGTWGVWSAVNDSFAHWQACRWAGFRAGLNPDGIICLNPVWLAKRSEYVSPNGGPP